jgi:hypothetical protein
MIPIRNIVLFALLLTLSCGGDVLPEEGFVPNAETATRIAEAVCIPIYGERNIVEQRPFIAKLHDGRWFVSGSRPDDINLNGGLAEVVISKKDGCILSVSHGK